MMMKFGILYCIVLNMIPLVTGESGYFWHITDFHYDYTYHGRQLSCNPNDKPDNPGKFGDFWCDSPWLLIDSSVKAMSRIKPNADFILWTGDTILHGKDADLSYEMNAVMLQNTTDVLRNVLPNVPVYATYGNHDYWPNNQFPPHNNLLYNDTWIRWEDWVNDPSQEDNFRKGGYYTIKTQHGLRIVALNTNLYYTSNTAILNETDPADQLQWLNTTLYNAKMNRDKVLVTAHIPFGVHTPSNLIWMHEKYHTPLVNILRGYTDIIVGMHFGHDHSDGFKVLHSSDGQHAAPVFMAPSVTPWRYIIPNKIGPAHNPGIRLVEYDRTTGQHKDLKQYYLDLNKANKDGVANWTLEYTFSDIYDTSALTGDTINAVVEEMKQSTNGQKLNKFWKHFTVSPPEDLQEPCNDECRRSIVCGFKHYEMRTFKTCKSDMISGSTSIFATWNICITVLGLIHVCVYFFV
ncbi:Acid sphingomyelinase-like phosphodiesterase 3a [Mactra antiquata]